MILDWIMDLKEAVIKDFSETNRKFEYPLYIRQYYCISANSLWYGNSFMARKENLLVLRKWKPKYLGVRHHVSAIYCQMIQQNKRLNMQRERKRKWKKNVNQWWIQVKSIYMFILSNSPTGLKLFKTTSGGKKKRNSKGKGKTLQQYLKYGMKSKWQLYLPEGVRLQFFLIIFFCVYWYINDALPLKCLVLFPPKYT